MKILSYLLTTAFAVCLLLSCNGNQDTIKADAQGTPYEVLVVCSQEKWDGAVGDTLRSILLEPVPVLNQKEPRLNVLRIQPQGFKDLLAKHRNALVVNTGKQYAEPSMTAQYDVYASPQLLVSLTGPNDSSIINYMNTHRAELVSIYEIAERDRAILLNKKYHSQEIEETIAQKFGFQMDLPRGYKIRNNQPKDFMWLSFEYPLASQGIVIYSYPYTGKDDFTADALTARRNQFTSLIPGPSDNSYMTTYMGFMPEISYRKINGRQWAEMRGFWDVAGDYMGGPFVSYSTLDAETQRVVTLDFYVFSPKYPKRNYLRGLENLIYSVSFPSDAPSEE